MKKNRDSISNSEIKKLKYQKEYNIIKSLNKIDDSLDKLIKILQ